MTVQMRDLPRAQALHTMCDVRPNSIWRDTTSPLHIRHRVNATVWSYLGTFTCFSHARCSLFDVLGPLIVRIAHVVAKLRFEYETSIGIVNGIAPGSPRV